MYILCNEVFQVRGSKDWRAAGREARDPDACVLLHMSNGRFLTFMDEWLASTVLLTGP